MLGMVMWECWTTPDRCTNSGTALEEEPTVGDVLKGQEVTDWLSETQQPLRLADLPQHSRSGRLS